MWSKRLVPVLLLLAGCSDPPMERLPEPSLARLPDPPMERLPDLCEVQLADVGALTIPVEFRPSIDRGPGPSGRREVPAGTAALVLRDNAPGKGGDRPVWVELVDEADPDAWTIHVARRHLRPTDRKR